MTITTYNKIVSFGFQGSQDTPSQDVITWLNSNNILRIEPYWRYLGSTPGYSWSRSWDDYSEKIDVECDCWEDLLEIALENSVTQALG